MRTYLGFKFKRRLAETLILKEVMAIIGCLVVVLAGVMLLHVDKVQAVAGTSVSSPTVSTYPETRLAGNHNEWNFQFTATSSLKNGDKITIDYPSDFNINSDESFDYVNNQYILYYGYSVPIVKVNTLAASSIIVTGQQLQIQIVNSVPAGSMVDVNVIQEIVSNPRTGGTKSILVRTSTDIDPVNIPVTIESSTLMVELSNKNEGAQKVNYKLTFKTRETIDYERPLYPVLPYDLVENIYAMDPSKVYLNGAMVDSIINSEVFSVNPSFGTNISPGETVTLEFTAEAGLSNPVFEEGDIPTKQIGIRFGNLTEWAEVTYTKDYIPPTGTVTVEGIPASNTIFSRSILLNLNATDEGSGVIAGYEVSDTDYFYGFDDRLEYKPQLSYLLPPGAGPKTIYVRFYDAAKNPSVTYQITVIYDDKLNLGSLTVKDENIANVALSPSFSDALDVYDAVVGSSVNRVKINLSKSAAANIILDDSRAVYTAVNSTNGEITFSNLGFGSNDLKIRVSAAEGNKDYHLIIFKEGPELQHSKNTTVINNGSIVVFGGKQWVLTDKTKRQLTLLQPYTECAWYDSSNCNWDGYGNSWDTEGWYDGYTFDPMAEDSVAYYLNNEFLNTLGQENIGKISMYPFDNTIYSKGTVPTRWSEEYRVKALVGLLSIPQYQSLVGTGVLNRFLGSEWFLMNPAHAGSDYYIFSVDSEGSLVANWNSKEVHPVVYLKPGMVISGGSGNEVSPYTLTSFSNNAALSSLSIQVTNDVTTHIPDTYKNVSMSVANAVYSITVTGAVYESGAKLSIKTSTGSDVYIGQPINLNEGANVFTIVVTAPDGATTLTYMLTITRSSSGTGGQQEASVNNEHPIVTLTGGTTIDFTGSTFGPNAKVSVTEVTPMNTGGTGLVSAGKTLEFTLTGITIDPLKPVKVSIPTNANANRSKVGVFYYNPSTLSWEYQKTEIDNTGVASAKVTHFSTYGVFEANKVATPTLDSLYTNDTTKQVTLSTSTEGAAIYFTLDGSEPTTASSLYNSNNKPKLLSTQTLKTIAVKNGMVTSDTVSFVGKARKTITNILTSILNKADQNGDSQFDHSDVRALLNQVEAVRGH
ncbi:cadherin-like beta sandwich domain-containing protein [Paenibacillus sp. FSL H8-0034]|uniref:cadherin-like beta sandwich domain-containing protein n=1 Tax=Paenibacillus sp. FSL H8-0034 TaxID=2954671 RepID=UPI0030F9E531